MRTLMMTVASGVLFTTAAVASPPEVTNAWARASAGPATTGAAYVTVTAGAEGVRLTGAKTPVAKTAGLHESSMQGGIMRMRAVKSIKVPAGKAVSLAPGGYHIMLFNLHHKLEAGQTFPLTLTFAHAAPVTVTVHVRPIGAAALGRKSMDGMDHGAMGGMNPGQMGKTQ